MSELPFTPTVNWGDQSAKTVAYGLYRGVVYTNQGYEPWNGLISVDEVPDKGGSKDTYLDGIWVSAYSYPDTFSYKIETYTLPRAIQSAVGLSASRGVYTMGQPKHPVTIAYTTKAQDTEEYDIVHILYNLHLDLGDQVYKTNGDKVDISTYSLEGKARPLRIPGFYPTAHFMFNLKEMTWDDSYFLMTTLFGIDEQQPRPLTESEIKGLANGELAHG